MGILDIQSIDKIQNLQKDAETKYNVWGQKLSELELEKEINQVEAQLKTIDVNKIKTADQFYSTLKQVDDIYSSIKETSATLKDVEKDLTSDLKNIKNQVNQVDDWVKDDYTRAFALAKIPEINAENIGKIIFGKKAVNEINTYLRYIAQAREYTNSADTGKPAKESPPRLKGQDIYFYDENARPDFWIRHLNISGETENKIALSGLVKNIVSDQRLIGATTDINIEGKSSSGVQVALSGILNYLGEQPTESFDLQYSGFSLANYQLSDSKFLPNKVKNGNGSVLTALELLGDQIRGQVSFTGKNLQFDFAKAVDTQNEIEKLIQSVINSVSNVNFLAKIEGKADDIRFSVHSNLDEILFKKMSAVVEERIAGAKQEIKDRIDNEVNKYRTDLNQLVSAQESLVIGEYKKYKSMLDNEKQQVDAKKKEIENKYEKEKSKIEDKVKDLLKF
jgi:uncharacterized protein (TIGR03545 family)